MELMVVIAIIGILMCFMIPTVSSSREAARSAQRVNNLKQIVIALRNYNDQYQAIVPGRIFKIDVGPRSNGSEQASLGLLDRALVRV
jgi:type II secretory pathway pseudopilin PulG